MVILQCLNAKNHGREVDQTVAQSFLPDSCSCSVGKIFSFSINGASHMIFVPASLCFKFGPNLAQLDVIRVLGSMVPATRSPYTFIF